MTHKVLLLALAAAFTLVSCKNSDNSNNGTTPTPGNWKVTYFFHKSDDTQSFNGYVFEIGSNGSFNASKSGSSQSGAWLTGLDDSKDKFTIDFSGTPASPLDEIEEDWQIIQMDDQLIHLEHTSGGNGDTDVLKLEKI